MSRAIPHQETPYRSEDERHTGKPFVLPPAKLKRFLASCKRTLKNHTVAVNGVSVDSFDSFASEVLANTGPLRLVWASKK